MTAAVRNLTPKQEIFCLRIVERDAPSEAYRRAYDVASMSDETISVEAARLLRHARVKARIAELRTSLQRCLGVSRATLVHQLDEVIGLARGRSDLKAMLAGIMAKAKLLGFVDAPGRPQSPLERSAFGESEFDKVD